MNLNYRIDISKDTETETIKDEFPFFWKVVKKIDGKWTDTDLYGWTKTEYEAFVNGEIAFNNKIKTVKNI